jgi:hypothetical protein
MGAIREPKGILPYSPENYPEKIPDFATEEEARDFWDTHDSSYYWDQFETVADFRNDFLPDADRKPSTARRRPGSEPMELLSVRFPTSMIEGIKTVAERRHLPYQTMLRSWVGERLEQELETAGPKREQKKAS